MVNAVEELAALPLVQAVGDDRDTARAAWAFAHGMAILELNGRFPPGADIDAAWRRGIEAFRAHASGGAADDAHARPRSPRRDRPR